MTTPENTSTALQEPLPALFNDQMLLPYLGTYRQRCQHIAKRRQELLQHCGNPESLYQCADWHLHYGLHRQPDGNWRFREWLPNATHASLLGEFNNWSSSPWFELHPCGNGDWEVDLPAEMLSPGQSYQLYVEWPGGSGWRLPSALRQLRREQQSDGNTIFNALVWAPETPYCWQHDDFTPAQQLLIYEAHVGIALPQPRIGTFNEFREQILPRIAAEGYTAVQFMAIAAHPYYGSFGYHVANFFAVSDLFGTPDDFKALVDAAHGLGMRVIMDLVHSHSVRNELEGLVRICGDQSQYFHTGARGDHPAWDSYCFNYSSPQVARMLLSNCRYWLEEYHLDGFRFDGVTSMLYLDHGLNRVFASYEDYFSPNVDWDSMAYLTMANELCHSLKRPVCTIAEDVSGMPGLALAQKNGGCGFDYRLAMGVTDYWFKLLDRPDEFWDIGELWHELTNRRQDESTISYVECHDQAIVGGQSFLHRCIGNAVYDAMDLHSENMIVARGIALHKMARLATAASAGGGYMNFIGNEFGHPEWLDLPRAGNFWSFEHAYRRWDLCDNPQLRFQQLQRFDMEMLKIIRELPDFYGKSAQLQYIHCEQHLLAFQRCDQLFIFNFHPTASYTNHPIPVNGEEYELILDSDAPEFGGFGRLAPRQHFYALGEDHCIRLYLPTRTAMVLKLIPSTPAEEPACVAASATLSQDDPAH